MRENSIVPRSSLLLAGLWAGLMLAGASSAPAGEPAPAPGHAATAPPLVLAESVLNQEPKPRPLRVSGEEPAAVSTQAGSASTRKPKAAPAVKAGQPAKAKTKASVKTSAKSGKKAAQKPAAKTGPKPSAKTKKTKKVDR